MQETHYIKQLKKVIRAILKQNIDKDIKNHIDIIKGTLVYISKVILTVLKAHNKDIHSIVKLSDESITSELKSILGNTQSQYDYKDFLHEDSKIKIAEILSKIDIDIIKGFSLGELYENFTTASEKKLLGQVYTPKDTVEYMVSSVITEEDFIKNPYLKVIDPACGGGYFVLEVYRKIKKIICENYDKIIMRDNSLEEKLNKGIHKFILENNIWGLDIDNFAVYMTKFSLIIKGDIKDINTNIYNIDSLIDSSFICNEKFDVVLCNPPYIGHKKIDKDYRKLLESFYSKVYSDKGDISYCFFKKGYDILNDDGKLSYITSRYFQESQSGIGLRSFIKDNFSIEKIVDFYGENIFKGIGISPVIIECTKSKSKNTNIRVYKKRTDSDKSKEFEQFTLNQEELLDSGWILLSEKEKKLFDKIHKTKSIPLDDICIFNQGIITGCDKAFIVTREEIEENRIEKELIKPWIKNSDVDKFHLKNVCKYIIYTDKIDNIYNYPNAISYVENYKEKLLKRRECIRGVRAWYELQWGRTEELFKKEKIVFPYKSSKNKFTIVREEVCSSADVYFLTIKDGLSDIITLEYLVAFLNSTVFEYYFKCVAKKLNDKLYEYYPNKLMELNIKLGQDNEYIEGLVKEIEYNLKQKNKIEIKNNIESIDKWFYKLYNLNKQDIDTIEKAIDMEGRLNTWRK